MESERHIINDFFISRGRWRRGLRWLWRRRLRRRRIGFRLWGRLLRLRSRLLRLWSRLWLCSFLLNWLLCNLLLLLRRRLLRRRLWLYWFLLHRLLCNLLWLLLLLWSRLWHRPLQRLIRLLRQWLVRLLHRGIGRRRLLVAVGRHGLPVGGSGIGRLSITHGRIALLFRN